MDYSAFALSRSGLAHLNWAARVGVFCGSQLDACSPDVRFERRATSAPEVDVKFDGNGLHAVQSTDLTVTGPC